MQSNFAFLNIYWSELAELGADAENQLYYDNSACAIKIGVFAEKLTNEILYSERMEEYIEENQYDKICILEEERIISSKYKDILHNIRMKRNSVSHDNEFVSDYEASQMLYDAYRLAVWFAKEYCDKNIEIPIYRKPRYRTTIYNESETVKYVNERAHQKTKIESSGTKATLIVALMLSLLLNIYLLFIR